MKLAFHPVVTALLALVPAVISYRRGRALLTNAQDPALPERLLALSHSNAQVAGVAIGLMLMTAPRRLVWALPLMIFVKMLAAYPLRRALHNETWSVWAYLSFYIRLIVAACGFWVFVGAAPFIAALAGTRDWMAAIVLGAIGAAWNARYTWIFRAVLRSEPVNIPAIRSRFAQLTDDCGLPRITLDQVRVRGGSFMNAIALPSALMPAVVVTDTLLERLDEDETTAILAHELAHHEHYKGARLKRGNIAAWVIIGLGAMLATILRLAALPASVLLIWPVALVAALILRLQQRQIHETESDLRAVALTRDPEALVRALTKLHTSARVPRRWDTEFERRATHPSLARRIQAIRRASGSEPATLTGPATFAAKDTTASVTFFDDRLEWRDASSMTHAIRYEFLRELRIDARSSSAPELVFVDAMARRWTIPLQAADIARAQSALDIVDVHLGKPDAPGFAQANRTRLATLLVLVAGLAAGQIAVLLTAVLALIQPASQIAVAAGVSAIAAAGLAWRDRSLPEWNSLSGILPFTLALAGAALIAFAAASRRDAPRGLAPKKVVAALAVFAALSWAAMALFGTSGIDLHRNVRELPGAVVLTFACAGALAFYRSPQARLASLAVAVVAAFAGYAGSTDFVDRFVHDSFVAPAPLIKVTERTMPRTSEVSIDFYPSSLSLSPGAGYVAIASEDAHEQAAIHAGNAAGPLAAFTADEAVFVTEGELLLLELLPRESVLRLIDLAGGGRESWTLKVPVRWPALSVDVPSRTWRLMGQGADGDIANAEGRIGSADVRVRQWKAPPGVYAQPLAESGGTMIALETRNDSRSRIMRLLPLASAWSLARSESALWSLTSAGNAVFASSNAALSCHSSPASGELPMCAAFDGTRTRFFTVDPKTRALTALASVVGRMFTSGMDDRGWLDGWLNQGVVAVHPATRAAIQFNDGAGEQPYHVAVSPAGMAAVFSDGGTSTVRVYATR